MGRIEQTVDFGTAPAAVWAVVADPTRFGEWLSMHRSWQGEPPVEFEPGTTATAVVAVASMPMSITWTVVDVEPGHLVTLTGAGPAGVEVSIGLWVEPRVGGSTMAITARFDGPLLAGAIGEAVERAARAELTASTTALARLIG